MPKIRSWNVYIVDYKMCTEVVVMLEWSHTWFEIALIISAFYAD